MMTKTNDGVGDSRPPNDQEIRELVREAFAVKAMQHDLVPPVSDALIIAYLQGILPDDSQQFVDRLLTAHEEWAAAADRFSADLGNGGAPQPPAGPR